MDLKVITHNYLCVEENLRMKLKKRVIIAAYQNV
jgi:hypothetical protein